MIGDFDTFVQKRSDYSKKYQKYTKEELILEEWKEFYNSRMDKK